MMTAPSASMQENAAETGTQSGGRWPAVALAILGLSLATILTVLKFGALSSWRYTSDLFVTDLMLQETLRGHFALEYTYGCQFGDHACLMLLLFLPIKWLLRKHMVWFLIMVTPATLLLSGAVLFAAARRIAGAGWATVAGLLWFCALGVIRGPFEFVYGFHVDTISGFVAVMMAALLLCRNESGPKRGISAAAIAMICAFVLLKEEMALLGIGFFTCLLLVNRDRVHIAGLVISIVAFAVEMGLIRHFRTPFNRTNEHLLRMLIDSIRQDGLVGFLFAREKAGYWLAILAFVVAMAACAAISRRLNAFAACLFLTGLAKLFFGWGVRDFELWSWHNYPGFVMLSGAVILQSLELRHLDSIGKPLLARITAGVLLAASVGWFASAEIPFAIRQHAANATAMRKNAPYMLGLADVQKQVSKAKVVSVPRYSVAAWTDGYRFTFFPHGISQSPMGIADYLVVPRNKGGLPVPELKAFVPIYGNRRYRLYARKTFLPQELIERQKFVKCFGADAIGPARRKSAQKKKHSPEPSPTTVSASAGSRN